MAEALKITDLCKTYITNKRQNNVLKNVSFSIGKGEMTAVMGPSGFITSSEELRFNAPVGSSAKITSGRFIKLRQMHAR